MKKTRSKKSRDTVPLSKQGMYVLLVVFPSRNEQLELFNWDESKKYQLNYYYYMNPLHVQYIYSICDWLTGTYTFHG